MRTAILSSFFTLFASVIILNSCSASQPSNPPSPAKQPASQTPSGTTMAPLAAAKLAISMNGSMTSLQDIARANGKTLTVFQFSGVTCESCKVDSPVVTTQLAPYASSVARVVIFPNRISEYTDAEYRGFVDRYATGSSYGVDNDLTLIKSIRSRTDQFFGVYLIVRPDGTGMVLNQDDAWSRVTNQVKLALGQG